MSGYWRYIEVLWEQGMYEPPRPNGQVLEHREIAASTLGRRLTSREVVHHKDEDKRNNSPANLVVFASLADHSRYHQTGRMEQVGDGTFISTPLNGSSKRDGNGRTVPLCEECGTVRTSGSQGVCIDCFKEWQSRNIPDRDTLERLVWEKPTTSIAKEFGVSDTAVGKWCRKYGISKPPRGYWMKNKGV